MEIQLPPPEPFEFKNVRDGIYLAKGGVGANAGFFVTGKSIMAIDAKMDHDSAAEAVEAIKKVSQNPITNIIITHSDIDHVQGLNAFPEGMTIFSHEAAKKDMEMMFDEPSMQHLKPYLPNRTFNETIDIEIDGVSIRLIHVSPAHTNGDVVVFFPEQKTVFTGDLVLLDRDPLVHLHKNGSSFGLLRFLEEILKLDADIFIGGHCEYFDKKQIKEVMNAISDKQEKVGMFVKEDKDLDFIKQALNVKEFPSPPGIPVFPTMEEVIYNELKAMRKDSK